MQVVFSLLLFLSLLGFAYGQISFSLLGLSSADFPVQHWWLLCFLCWIVLGVVLLLCKKCTFAKLVESSSFAIVGVLLLLVCSDVSSRRYAFYPGEDARLFIFLLGVPLALLHWFRWRYERVEDTALRCISLPLLLFFQALIALLFLDLADGRIIFSDDHPSFWYRLHLLQQQFPRIPFYSPAWEAGYSAREFFATGVLNVFFLSYPLWLLDIDLRQLEQAVVYNYLLLYIYVGILPLSTYAATRLLGYGRIESSAAGILALGPSMGQFEWLLKYGTLGFSCAVGMLPLAIVLVYRLAFANRTPRWWHVFALLFVSFLCISWSLLIFAFVPAVLLALCTLRETFAPPRRMLLIAFSILFVGLNAPWMKVFVEESKVFSFVQRAALPGEVVSQEPPQEPLTLASLQSRAEKVIHGARELIAKVNPLVVLLFIPGLLLLNTPRQRQLFASTIGFLLLLAFLGEELKPQLELRRFIIPAAYLACIPTALAMIALLRALYARLQTPRRVLWLPERLFAGLAFPLVLGMFLFSAVSVAAAYQNRVDHHYRFAPDFLMEFVDTVKQHAGEGRVFFLGFVLHDFGATDYKSQDGGHIAILTALTGVPMYAHYYYHSHWQSIDPIPQAYRDRGSEGIEEFLDLLHVTSVATAKREWVRYCSANPNYKKVAQIDRFSVFERRAVENGFLIEGRADIEERLDGLVVRPYTETIRLKYRFLPKLRSVPSEGVELFSFPVFEEDTDYVKSTAEVRTSQVEFLGMRVAPELLGKDITLGYWPSSP